MTNKTRSDSQIFDPSRPLLLFRGDEKTQVAGMPARDRNRRVAVRDGFEPAAKDDVRAVGAGHPVLVVPDTVTIQPGLLFYLPASEVVHTVRAGGPHDTVLWGPACAILRTMEGDSDPEWPRVVVPSSLILDISNDERARRATKTLLRAAAKPTDGFVARHVNRRLSRPLSALLLRLGLSPDHATFLNLVIGLAAAVLLAMHGWWTMALAGLLFQLASAWDGTDGEMARVTLRESPRGAWLDTVADNITYAACLLGVVVGWAREGVTVAGAGAAVGLLIGVLVALLILARFVRIYGPSGSFVFIDSCVERAARDGDRFTLRLIRVFFLGLRRDVFAAVFFFVGLAGQRGTALAVIGTGLALAAVCFAWQGRRILAAAKALRAEHEAEQLAFEWSRS